MPWYEKFILYKLRWFVFYDIVIMQLYKYHIRWLKSKLSLDEFEDNLIDDNAYPVSFLSYTSVFEKETVNVSLQVIRLRNCIYGQIQISFRLFIFRTKTIC